MGYVYVPTPSEPKYVGHICRLPLASNLLPGTVWQCDSCGTKYIYRASSASAVISLLLFIAFPIGMIYLGWTSGRGGWAKQNLVRFIFTLLGIWMFGLLIFVLWLLAASENYSSIGGGIRP